MLVVAGGPLARSADPLVDPTLAEPLLAAVKSGDAAAVKTLLARGADPETRNQRGWPVSVLAACRGYTEILRSLNERDSFSVYQTGPGNWDCLMEAAGNGHLETVRFLLACHAETHVANSSGYKAIDYAQQRHFPEICEVLRVAPQIPLPSLVPLRPNP